MNVSTHDTTTMSRAGFLPTLLDRLTEPTKQDMVPGRSQGRAAYQESVLRDLRWLLNSTTAFHRGELRAFPHASSSVLNFGIPCATGLHRSEKEAQELAKGIEQAILRFEPRILAESLLVEVVPEEGGSSHSHLLLRIHAAFWFEPHPIELSIRARWHVEGGLVEVESVSPASRPEGRCPAK